MKLYTGHVLEVLPTLPERSVQTICTSPPYWGLRKYAGEQDVVWPDGWKGAFGLEPTPALYIEHSMAVLDALWRVLRDDGVLWWNLSDSYCGDAHIRESGTENFERKGDSGYEGCLAQERPKSGRLRKNITQFKGTGLKPKDLCLVPFRFALAAQERGWWVRSDIIWSKPNPMPESVTDRPTRSHEYLFLLTKAARYYYDAEAVKEPARATNHHDYTGQGGYEAPGQPIHSGNRKALAGPTYERHRSVVPGGQDLRLTPIGSRNLRSVWTFATHPYPEAHFATFPPELPRRCILASTSPKACPSCGAPWARITETRRSFESGSGKAGHLPEGKNGPLLQGGGETVDIRRGPVLHTTTLGWKPTCSCPSNDGSGRCVVLDPFSGSGTTVQVAEELNREGWGIDISGEYQELQKKRVAPWQGQRRL